MLINLLFAATEAPPPSNRTSCSRNPELDVASLRMTQASLLGIAGVSELSLRFRPSHLDDVEWETNSLQVSSKSRHGLRLSVPQDVRDAIAAYLACRRTSEFVELG